MKSKVYLLIPLFILTLAGAGCAGTSTSSNVPADPHAGHMMGMGSQTMNEMTTLAGDRIELENANALKPGNVTLAFKLRGADGNELETNDLKVAHDKRLHLLVVRDDMTQFQHLHPEYTNGRWTVTSIFPEQGDYQMYIDIAPEKENPIVLRTPIRIGGATLTKAFPTPDADLSATDQGIKAQLSIDGGFRTGEAKQLTFSLTKDGKPVANIDPYLGAFGHVVLLRHNEPSEFLHVHPLTEAKPTDGKVVFETTFTKQGRHTLYAQFNVDGSVKTFPITIDVEEGGAVQMQGMDHSAH